MNGALAHDNTNQAEGEGGDGVRYHTEQDNKQDIWISQCILAGICPERSHTARNSHGVKEQTRAREQ